MTSGLPTLLAGRDRDFFVINFDSNLRPVGDEEVGEMQFNVPTDEFLPVPPVTLSKFQIHDKLNLDGDRHFTGSVAYRTTTPVTGNFFVRILFRLEDHLMTYTQVLDKGQLDGQGTIPIRFGGQFTRHWRKQSLGFLIVEMIPIPDLNKKDKTLVLSNALAEMVYVRDTKKH